MIDRSGSSETAVLPLPFRFSYQCVYGSDDTSQLTEPARQ